MSLHELSQSPACLEKCKILTYKSVLEGEMILEKCVLGEMVWRWLHMNQDSGEKQGREQEGGGRVFIYVSGEF